MINKGLIRNNSYGLSINLSGQSLGDDRFLDFVLDQLEKPGMIAELISLFIVPCVYSLVKEVKWRRGMADPHFAR